jgi:hypothetical protein
MSVGVVDICNQALAGVGARSSIASLNENSNEARKCLLFYATTRDELLRAAQWNFARKQDYLTLIKAAPGTPENPIPPLPAWNPQICPPQPWQYSYAVPANSVRVWSVLPYSGSPNSGLSIPLFSEPLEPVQSPTVRRGVRFVEGLDTDKNGNLVKCVMTNMPQAVCDYGMIVENPGLWDAQFRTAMIASLGYRLAIPVSGDKAMANMAKQVAADAIRAARVTDGNEGTTNVNTTPDWLAIRGVSGDWSSDNGYMAPFCNPSFLVL